MPCDGRGYPPPSTTQPSRNLWPPRTHAQVTCHFAFGYEPKRSNLLNLHRATPNRTADRIRLDAESCPSWLQLSRQRDDLNPDIPISYIPQDARRDLTIFFGRGTLLF